MRIVVSELTVKKREEDLTVVERFNSNVDTIDALFGEFMSGIL